MNWRTKSSIPRLLLIDPTTACNLECTGCWARDYSKNVHLSYEKLDELCTDAQKLGVLQIVFSGGEPMMRKEDILKLAEEHRKLTFAMFTNGTLIDEGFAASMARLGNLNAFISIEGSREETDMRRGSGVYDQAIRAMDLLKKYDIGFGYSTCYHAKNYKTIASDEFLDLMREKGAWLGWLFIYMPIGKDADMSLCCNAQQRAYVKQKLEDYQKKHGFLAFHLVSQNISIVTYHFQHNVNTVHSDHPSNQCTAFPTGRGRYRPQFFLSGKYRTCKCVVSHAHKAFNSRGDFLLSGGNH